MNVDKVRRLEREAFRAKDRLRPLWDCGHSPDDANWMAYLLSCEGRCSDADKTAANLEDFMLSVWIVVFLVLCVGAFGLYGIAVWFFGCLVRPAFRHWEDRIDPAWGERLRDFGNFILYGGGVVLLFYVGTSWEESRERAKQDRVSELESCIKRRGYDYVEGCVEKFLGGAQ